MKPIHISLQLGKVDVAGKQDAGRELQSLAGHGEKNWRNFVPCCPKKQMVWGCAETAKWIMCVKECKSDVQGIKIPLSIFHYSTCTRDTGNPQSVKQRKVAETMPVHDRPD